MAVAKSYENMELMGQPFERDSKMYIKVKGKCPRCGGSGHYSYNQMDGTRCYGCGGSGIRVMEVRWYTDKQRATMDRAAEKRKGIAVQKQEERRIKFAARNAFGFGKEGFITLIWCDDNEKIKSWRTDLPQHTVLYNNLFGWYIPSEKTLKELPDFLTFKRVEWNEVRNEEDPENLMMKEHEEVRKYIHSLKYGESKSTYQGQKDDWLEKDVIIKKNISVSGRYGDSHMHIMEDSDENVYVWTTASKSLEEGKTVHMKMKVKDHQEYNGVQQTIVYYCKIK